MYIGLVLCRSCSTAPSSHALETRPAHRGGDRKDPEPLAGDTIITLIGNLTAEPKLRFTPSGAAVVLLGTAMTGGSVGDLWESVRNAV